MEKHLMQHSAAADDAGSELDLVRRIMDGDRRAEAEIYRRYADVLRAIIRKRLGAAPPEDIDDIMSEVQLAMLQSLREGRFDSSKGQSLGSYLYGIARFKIMDYLRRRNSHEGRISDLPPSQEPSVAEDRSMEREERAEMLREAMEKLKPKYREVLYLRYFKELSITEISEELSLPHRRVSERIHYAVKLLRERCRGTDLFSIFVLPIRIPDQFWRVWEQ